MTSRPPSIPRRTTLRNVCAWLTLTALMQISGCATFPTTRLDTGMEAPANGPAGYLFGTIGHGSRFDFTTNAVYFRRVGSAATGSFHFSHTIGINPPIDVRQGEAKATLFMARLTPGRYELVDMRIAMYLGPSASLEFSAAEPMRIPFEIVEGRATYLGEFLSFPVHGKNFFGGATVDAAYFVVSDQLQRDRTLLVERNPTLRDIPVDNRARIAVDAGISSFRSRR